MEEGTTYSGYIDIEKLMESGLHKHANGKTYLRITIRPSKDSFGNSHMIVQYVPKAQLKENERCPIIGNAKPLVFNQPYVRKPSEKHSQRQAHYEEYQKKMQAKWYKEDEVSENVPF